MRPPLMKRAGNEPAPTTPPLADSKHEGYAEKVKLAQHLHEQGINPLRWTEAHPAPQSAQQEFQATGRKARDNQFESGGKLYDWSPAVSASPAQAKVIAEAYTATPQNPAAVRAVPRVEGLVDIDKVPLQHPLGTPHKPRGEMNGDGTSMTEERTALYRHYAKSAVDPDKAHLGDPLPMAEQAKLKAEIPKVPIDATTDMSGLPNFYQGFDDGWIYMANPSTKESTEIQRIRRDHGTSTSPTNASAANDNDATVEDRIAEHYRARDENSLDIAPAISPSPSEKTAPVVKPLTEAERVALAGKQLDDMARWMPALVTAIEKAQRGESLTTSEQELSKEIGKRFADVGIWFDPKRTNLDFLRETAKAVDRTKDNKNSKIPLHVLALATNGAIAEALVGGSMDWAKLAQIGWPEAASQSINLLKSDRINALLGAASVATNTIELFTNPQDRGEPDLLSIPAEWGKVAANGISSMLDGPPSEIEHYPSAISSVEQGQRQRELRSATPPTLKALNDGLADATEVEILIGGVPLFKQSEHKTLMDEIFRQEFIKIAQEKGCLPKPNDPDAKDKFHDYGGLKPQQRITDIDQDGHLGSRQTDSGMRWKNPDETWTEVLWNSTTPLVNGFTETIREWRALVDIIVKADKHLALGHDLDKLYRFTKNPVLGDGPLYHMAEKPTWTEEELRDFIAKKLRERFDRDFKNCKFIGESRIVKIDHPDDPDLPQKPHR